MPKGNKVFREVMKGIREGTSTPKEEARKAQSSKEAEATRRRANAQAEAARNEKAKREAEQEAVERTKKIHESWKEQNGN